MIQWFILWQLLQTPSAYQSNALPPEWVARHIMQPDFPEPDAQTVWYTYPDGGKIKLVKSDANFESGRQTLCIEWYPPE